MSTIAIILARGGSQGVKRKNIRILGNKPLVAWTIEAALQSRVCDDVYVSSEDDEILFVATEYGAKHLRRPDGLATSHVQSNEVFLYAYRQLEELGQKPDRLVLLLPTVPSFLSKYPLSSKPTKTIVVPKIHKRTTIIKIKPYLIFVL